MKVFDRELRQSWGDKVNFVDENNVVLGYDMGQSCCEEADWYIADKPNAESGSQPKELFGYVFDVEYRKDTSKTASGMGLDEGGAVEFRLTAEGQVDLYLTIYNAHNGYYGHGFDFKIGDEIIEKGCL